MGGQGTDSSDVLIALVVAIPATIGALAGLVAAWQARKAKQHAERASEEVRSPNGTKTGDVVYKMDKRVEAMEIRQQRMDGRQQQMAEAMREMEKHAAAGRARQEVIIDEQRQMRKDQQGHLVADGIRFGALFRHMEIEDPIGE